jgi:hypothetical protein
MPVIILTSVDFPLPDFPTTPTNSLGFTRRFTPLSASKVAAAVVKRFTTRRTSMRYPLCTPMKIPPPSAR